MTNLLHCNPSLTQAQAPIVWGYLAGDQRDQAQGLDAPGEIPGQDLVEQTAAT
jgi:hypothetical protein